ncbi:hypothetical protein Tco_0425511 [Tanacetum coccineum]
MPVLLSTKEALGQVRRLLAMNEERNNQDHNDNGGKISSLDFNSFKNSRWFTNTFHVSNLRKYYADEPLAVPLDELHFDDKLRFVEKPAEIMDREVKRLRQSRVPIVKVDGTCEGPEFT